MSLIGQFRANGEVWRHSDGDVAKFVGSGGLASLKHGEEFMEERLAEVFLSECGGDTAGFLNVFDVFVASSAGAVEYFPIRGNLKSMLQSKSIKPKSIGPHE
jgi:hypothetical protein